MLLFFSKLMDGGPVFMFPILIMLLIIIVLFVRELMKKRKRGKTMKLIASISWLAVGWGVLGQILGLISAFDTIEAAGNVSPGVLAGGLKISFLTTAFGLLTFLIGRLLIIGLTVKEG